MTRRGEIYWLDFGTPEGSEPGFRRPALIVQNDTGNQHGRTTIVAAVTSTLPPSFVPHVVVVEPADSGLPQRSAIMLNQLRTVDQSRLEELCGVLSPRRMSQIDRALRAILSLD